MSLENKKILKIWIFIIATVAIILFFIPIKEKIVNKEIEDVGISTVMPRIYIKKQKFNIYNFPIYKIEETLTDGDEYYKLLYR